MCSIKRKWQIAQWGTRWQLVAHPDSFWWRRVAMGLGILALWWWRVDAPALALSAAATALLCISISSLRTVVMVGDGWYGRAIAGERALHAGLSPTRMFWSLLLVVKLLELFAIGGLAWGLWQISGWQVLAASGLWFAARYYQLELMGTVSVDN
jgi:hypothetical protein